MSIINRISRQEINMEIEDLNNTVNQLDLTNIYTTFHPTTADETFFLSAHGTFSWVYNILDNKTSLNKFRNTESIQSIFFYHHGTKLEISKTRKI